MKPRDWMSTGCIAGLLACVALAEGAAQAAWDPVTEDPPAIDTKYPAEYQAVAIQSHGARMNGVLFIAQGVGPHRTVVLPQGFHGGEKNLDLAHAIRRAGWNVLTFQYRGAWGSAGEFSFGNVLEDVAAAVAFVRGSEGLATRCSPNQVVLVGHSMGGWAALIDGARDDGIQAVVSVAGWNSGRGAQALADPAKFAAEVKDHQARLGPLRAASADALVRERIAHAHEWDLLTYVPALAKKPVLLIVGQRDDSATVADHHSLLAALEARKAESVRSVVLDSDHFFSDKRIALARAIVSWLRTRRGQG